MLNAFEVRLHDLKRRILTDANVLPPEYQNYADETARVVLHDIDEQLWGCADEAEADALVRQWLAVTA